MVIWQHKAGVDGRLQITCNAVFDGQSARQKDGFLNIFIAGAKDGQGELGQPKPIKHNVGSHQTFALVLRSGYRSSAIYCNGILADVFTAPRIVQQPTYLYAFPGVMNNFDSSGQQITSLNLINRALLADEVTNLPPEPAGDLVDLATASFTVYRAGTGDLVMQNGATEPIVPASLIKVVTAMTAIDYMMVCPKTMTVQPCDIAPGSGNNLKPGDKMEFADALNNLLLESSNTTANLIAREVGSTIPGESSGAEKFIRAMNHKCLKLGMLNTTVKNPSGLHRFGQHSTVADLTKAALAATEYPMLMAVWSNEQAQIKIGGIDSRVLNIKHTHQLSAGKSFRGGKTGTLTGSNGTQNLLTVYERNGEMFVSVIASKFNRYSAFAQIQNII